MIATIRAGLTAAKRELGLAEKFPKGSEARTRHLQQAIKEFESSETRITLCKAWINSAIKEESQ